MSAKTVPLTLALLLAAAAHAPAADADRQVLAARARDVLRAHCYRCHGQDGSVEGAMNYVADLPKPVARTKGVPRDPPPMRPPPEGGPPRAPRAAPASSAASTTAPCRRPTRSPGRLPKISR